MGLSNMFRGRGATPLHFLVRLLGLTGLALTGIGLVLLAAAVREHAPLLTAAGGLLAGVGGLLVVVALVFEIRRAVELMAGRRGAVGSSIVVQILLAALLLVGVNAFSFLHYQRFDWTRDRLFTIRPEIRNQLSQLRGETTVVVYLPHRTFGQQSDKPSDVHYASAAERKVVEKVKDLVQEFQELGPQFKVIVLDAHETEGAEATLDALTREAPNLRDAIDRARENSIFFYADGKVQELGFQDVYQLDKQASQDEKNLVLYSQGVEPFARKLLNPDEKRPRIAFGVIHETLGLNGSEMLGMTGLKKVLTSHGFDYRDIIFKKWGGFSGPEPAVRTYEENKYEGLEEELAELDANIKAGDEDVKGLRDTVKLWQTASLDELTKKYEDQLGGHKLTEQERRLNLPGFQQKLTTAEFLLQQAREERRAIAREKQGVHVESLNEQRRIGDLRAKTSRMLADCDMLLLPRATVFNAAHPAENIPNFLYKLDGGQVEAIKDFIKAGKPVLFCLGPANDPPGQSDPFGGAPDGLDDLLTDLGIHLGKQTILFNVESKSFAERRGNLLILGETVEPPPVSFDWQPGEGQILSQSLRVQDKQPNPIRESMRLTAGSLGKDQALDLRLRGPRPVYYEPRGGPAQPFDPVFMMTSPASWNDDQPFPTRERTPRYQRPRPGDLDTGTVDEKRHGPFPIGVSVETTVPRQWYEQKDARPATVRVAVIGNGGLFIGPNLSPTREKLFLDVSNWLLGRDDLLARADHRWEYPRVPLSPLAASLWPWGTWFGLPALFIFVGLVVLLVRRLR